MSATDHDEEQDWPDPVVVLNEGGASDIVLICEHASNHIPRSFQGLGLPEQELKRHIAWDIGAEDVARGLSERLDAICFLGTYSRLLIDLNRPLESPTSIPVRSESTNIPGNVRLQPGDRQQRIGRIFEPFQRAIAHHLDERHAAGRKTRIVAIHSFTPTFLGEHRPWHAGILFNLSQAFAAETIARLRGNGDLTVGANVPYVIDRREDYAIPVHGEDRGHAAILIEIRQDLLASKNRRVEWIDRLALALGE